MGPHHDNEESQKCKMKSSNSIIYISDREEGEIVDTSDLEDVSDISSEEEFLLRQRIKILENFNDVLERKEAKRRSFSKENSELQEIITISLSDLSSNEDEPKKKEKPLVKSEIKMCPVKKIQAKKKPSKMNKTYHRGKGRRKTFHKNNTPGISNRLINKKHGKLSNVSESSAESDRENREKRRKLREAVQISSHNKNDNTSLKLRLLTMLHKETNSQEHSESNDGNNTLINLTTHNDNDSNFVQNLREDEFEAVDKITIPDPHNLEKASISDDDVDALRQLALQTKSKHTNNSLNNTQVESTHDNQKEEIDSDTAELRLIALKSAIIKKAIERKQRQKTIAKLKSSQSSFVSQITVNSELETVEEELQPSTTMRNSLSNGTDIESVDMDIDDNPSNDECSKIENVQHEDDKGDNYCGDHTKVADTFDDISFGQNDHKLYLYNVYSDIDNPYKEFIETNIQKLDPKENHNSDDIDEDEDILRAKLLTSLSNNIKITNKNVTNDIQSIPIESPSHPPHSNVVINLGESDSGTDCESTRNLKIMHKKLTEQANFQKNLDLFLKDARTAAENAKLAKEKPLLSNIARKSTPMAVKYLPQADQDEYKRTLRRMAELEKLKQVRQAALLKNSNGNLARTAFGKGNYFQKQKLKTNPNMKFITSGDKNNVLDAYLNESRDKLEQATENILKLRQEIMQQTINVQNAFKQLKFAKQELQLKRHALTLAENTLKSRQLVYRSLLKRSYKQNSFLNQVLHNDTAQKSKTKPIIPDATNDAYVTMQNQMQKVQLITANSSREDQNTKHNKAKVNTGFETTNPSNETINKEQSKNECVQNKNNFITNPKTEDERIGAPSNNDCDYQSPLQYKNSNVCWTVVDPNAVLCPFLIAGECKDSDCIYLHPHL